MKILKGAFAEIVLEKKMKFMKVDRKYLVKRKVKQLGALFEFNKDSFLFSCRSPRVKLK